MRLLQGDCLEAMAGLAADSVDAVLTDPPYGIAFQQEPWDGRAIAEAAARAGHERLSPNQAFEVWARSWATECLRVMKPGAHLAAFGSPRTFHRLSAGLEDAGLEIRDTLMWLYGSGMPKSRHYPDDRASALKPAWEPIVLARKPLAGTIEENLAHHGTGVLCIGECRVHGRHPADVLLSHEADCEDGSCARACAVAQLDAASERAPSRFFYCAKASRGERDAGCERLPKRTLDLFPAEGKRSGPARNPHPTVKPLELMRWLVRLLCPPGGVVLDPFTGSGSTGAAAMVEGRDFLGIEFEAPYLEIARARIEHWRGQRGHEGSGAKRGDRVAHEVNRALDPFGSLTMMAQSGAGGNIVQIAQIAGMRGLAALPSGEIAEMPIRSSFVAGLTPIEQLLGTQGTRRGALVTRSRQVHAADLLRRLVAATRDVAVTEDDCATARDQIDGIWIEGLTTYYQFRGGGMLGQENRLDHLVGRHLAADVVSETTGQLLLEAGTLMGEPERDLIREHRVVRVRVRSPMTCESRHGICRRCYGWDSMRRAPVEIGAPVGLLAALSLGGYADQLTMRIFRYGNPGRWVLKRDDEAIRTGAIRIGLPGIDALLETREAPHAAILSETAGVVEIEGEEESHGEARLIRVVSHWTNGDGGESYRDEHEYRLPPSSWVRVRNGERVPAGEPLTVGEPNPADILRILGRAAVQSALADELHALYSTQGVIVDDRHCEVVVRQMLRFVRITDAGDTAWLRGEIMDAFDFEDANLALRRAGGYEATAEPLVLGISEIAAHRAGFLAAALVDVEHTVRLRRAAIAGAVDRLDGLYERALVGALVPHSHPARTLSDDA